MDIPSNRKSPIVKVLIAAGVAAFVVILWEQHAAIQKIGRENERLTTLNAELKEGLLESQTVQPSAAPAPGVTEPAVAPESPAAEGAPAAESAAAASAPDAQATAPTAAPVRPENAPNTLALEKTTVEKTEEGLVANLHFKPAKSDPLGVVAIVVRVPRAGDARILDLLPKGTAKFDDVAKRISDDGKFAVFQGTPEQIADIEFALSVSGPVQADVRGTCGIGPFGLNIDADQATAQPTE